MYLNLSYYIFLFSFNSLRCVIFVWVRICPLLSCPTNWTSCTKYIIIFSRWSFVKLIWVDWVYLKWFNFVNLFVLVTKSYYLMSSWIVLYFPSYFWIIMSRLYGNPVCKNANQLNVVNFCQSQIIKPASGNRTSSRIDCFPCPTDLGYEYSPLSPIPCLCAVPLQVGLRLKSPAISDFRPYIDDFEINLSSLLNLYVYQLYFNLYIWEPGPRLDMYLKLFPSNSSLFNASEVLRLQHKFTGWEITLSDTFGPYELLNFTLGSYTDGMWCALYSPNTIHWYTPL